MKIVSLVFITALAALSLSLMQCTSQKEVGKSALAVDTILINDQGGQYQFQIEMTKGKAHNHPSFAIWLENLSGKYIKTLFVTQSVGTGIFGHGSIASEKWDVKPGLQQRPASLPYWLHKRSEALNIPLLPSPDNPVTDGETGATPPGSFILESGSPDNLPSEFRVLFEINQPWDWNEYWTNSLYDDPDYRTSCQPSLVYAGMIDTESQGDAVFLNPIGHGQYAGKDGKLYTDLRTMTTALQIVDHISVKLIKQ